MVMVSLNKFKEIVNQVNKQFFSTEGVVHYEQKENSYYFTKYREPDPWIKEESGDSFRIAASPKNIYFGCSFRDQGYHCSFDRSLLGNKDPEFKNPSVKISHFMHTNPEYASESIDASVNLNQIISLGCSFNP